MNSIQPGTITPQWGYSNPGLASIIREPTEMFSSLTGDERTNAELTALLCMLKHVALDPRESADGLEAVKQGVIGLCFFMISCPIPLVELDVEDPRLPGFIAAVQENINGPLARAAKRVLRVRNWPYDWTRPSSRARESKLLAQLSATLQWVSTGARRELTVEENRINTMSHDILMARRAQIRDIRRTRIALLEQAAAPAITSWHDLLEKMFEAGSPPNQ